MMIRLILKNKLTLLLFGIAASFTLIEISLHFASHLYYKDHNQNYRNPKNDKEIRILCLGESSTGSDHYSPKGEGADGDISYPNILSQVLSSNNDHRFQIINGGITNGDSSYLLFRKEHLIRKYHPQFIVIMMGINDDFHSVKVTGHFPGPTDLIFNFSRTSRLFRFLHRKLESTFTTYISEDSDDKDALKFRTSESQGMKQAHADVHFFRIRTLLYQIEYSEVRKMVQEYITNPDMSVPTIVLREQATQFMMNKNDRPLAEAFFLKYMYSNSALIHNYKRLIAEAKKVSAEIIIMQYPTLPLQPLREFIQRSSSIKNISFISNKEPFLHAVTNNDYDTFFYDRERVLLGHGTKYTNTIIANKVATKVLSLLTYKSKLTPDKD